MKAMNKMKRPALILALFLGFLAMSGVVGVAQSATMDDYNYLPPFLGVNAKPNILLMIDNSGSMNGCAYPNSATTGQADCNFITNTASALLSLDYDKTKAYSGYFDQTKCYAYSNIDKKFSSAETKAVAAPFCNNVNKPWDGSFLNWLTMRRIDVTKWVLTGGMCNVSPRGNANSCATLRGQYQSTWDLKKRANLTGVGPSSFNGVRCILIYGGDFFVGTQSTGTCSNIIKEYLNTANASRVFKIRVDAGANPTGSIQAIGDRARFGLMLFNTDDHGRIKTEVGAPVLTLVNAVEAIQATTWTPLAETLFQSARYFAQITPKGDPTNFTVGLDHDPYRVAGEWIKCCKSFVLVFTDGAPTQDLTIPATLAGSQPPLNATNDFAHIAAGHEANKDHHEVCSNYYDGPSTACVAGGGTNSSNRSHYLDEVAYWAHITDLRPDTAGANIATINEPSTANKGGNLLGMQNLNIYTFLAFDKKDGPNILKDAAKVGGFNDKNNNKRPDDGEWDVRNNLTGDLIPDGLPDTYFSADDAESMRANMLTALNAMLQESGSGTAVSFLATSSTGEGAVYQSYFFPQSRDSVPVSWLGYLQGLFLDNQGNLREDTNKDRHLVLNEDKVVRTYYDAFEKRARVELCFTDQEGNFLPCDPIPTPDPVTGEPRDGLSSITPIWEAGKLLANRTPSDRKIWTWIDGVDGPDGKVASSEVIPFHTGNADILKPYLVVDNATSSTSTIQSQNLIRFIRGEIVLGFRNRQTKADKNDTNLKTWKLGDILGSDPISVGTPKEAFDLKYNDESYTPFFNQYKNRRHVVYVGANDGMLHAFNGGFFHPGDDENTKDDTSTTVVENKKEYGYFTTGETEDNKDKDGNNIDDLGKELWAFIPQELLPHLQWLTKPEYDKTKHVFFVDGSPRVTDARIFPPDEIHPNGWGTILIGSMRMGGGLLNVDLKGNGMDTFINGDARFRSAYFAFDITNPEAKFGDPGNRLMWVFKDRDLGFTTGSPAIMRMKGGTPETWYAVFGSGPLSYHGERDHSSASNRFEIVVATTTPLDAPSEYGQFYVVNLETGKLERKQQMGPSDDANRYAFMGDPVAVDLEKDYRVDAVYIGKTSGKKDTKIANKWDWSGKVHRILTNIASPTDNHTPDKWTYSVLFDPEKPVLVSPSVTQDKDGRPWVLFGTGRLFSAGANSDHVSTSTQALYGIQEASKDGCWDKITMRWKSSCVTTVSNILSVEKISVEHSTTMPGKCVNCPAGEETVFELADKLRADYGGWIYTLPPGERVLSKITLLAGVVAVPSYTPRLDKNDVCEVGGTSTLYGIAYETGTAFFSDANKLGAFAELNSDKTIVSNVKLGEGIASRVSLISNEDNVIGKTQTSGGNIVSMVMSITPRKQGTKLFLEKTE
jgi:type IV pilus assembly protein PilY1